MDIHVRVTAAIHIVFGILGTLFMLGFALLVGGLITFLPMPDLPSFFLVMGAWLFGFMALFALAEAIAGVYLLKGSRTARGFCIVFSVLGLFSFPIGTVAGVYSLWALLRAQPAPLVLPESPVH